MKNVSFSINSILAFPLLFEILKKLYLLIYADKNFKLKTGFFHIKNDTLNVYNRYRFEET